MMGRTPDADALALENSALLLTWCEGVLQALNKRSGDTTVLDAPAFALAMDGERIPAEAFAPGGVEASADAVTFSYGHTRSGIEAQVRYWLEGDRPWFRKQVTLRAPEGTAMPDRSQG